MKKAIVLGGSRGIGKAISESLKTLDIDVVAASKADIDTTNMESERKFLPVSYTHLTLPTIHIV